MVYVIQVKPTRVDEDADVDIMTTEKVAAFSDSDESEDGLYFLPTVPDRDASPPRQTPPSPVANSPNTAQAVPKVTAGSTTPSNSAGSQDSDTEPDYNHAEQNSEGELKCSFINHFGLGQLASTSLVVNTFA